MTAPGVAAPPSGERPRATRRVRLLASLLTVAALLVAAEAGAWLGFLVIDRKPFSYARLAAERAALLQGAAPSALGAARPTPPPPARSLPGRPETTPVSLVPHPFFGFTYDPEDELLRSRQGRGALSLNEHGFFELPPLPSPREGRPFDVALFGGSLAAYVCIDGREALDAALQAVPELRGRPLRLSCFALGGFRQPQTAAAFNYLTILGRSFDVVIVLDGFNDIVLPFNEHKFKGTFPAYPRDWDHLVGGTPDLAAQRRIGRLAYLEAARAGLARRAGRWPWRCSVAAALAWRALDSQLARRIGAAQAELDRGAPVLERSYAGSGPRVSFASDAARLEHLAGLWERSSLQMHRLARASGARCFHFLQPNQYVPASKPMSDTERGLAWRADHPYRFPVEQGYPLLQQAGLRLRAQRAHFEDLTRLFEQVAEPLYVDDCCHVSPAGSAAIGRAVGQGVAAAW